MAWFMASRWRLPIGFRPSSVRQPGEWLPQRLPHSDGDAGYNPMVEPVIPSSPHFVDPDQSLVTALSRAGFSFQHCEGGGLALDVVFAHHGFRHGRSHRVIAVSENIDRFGVSFRRVYAMAFKTAGPPTPDQDARLLKENRFQLLGSWSIHSQPEGAHRVVFQMLVPVAADPEMLRKAVLAVALAADEMEEEMTGEDHF